MSFYTGWLEKVSWRRENLSEDLKKYKYLKEKKKHVENIFHDKLSNSVFNVLFITVKKKAVLL